MPLETNPDGIFLTLKAFFSQHFSQEARDFSRREQSETAMKYYKDGEAGNKEAARKAYELYQRMHTEYPDRDYGKYAMYVKNHMLGN